MFPPIEEKDSLESKEFVSIDKFCEYSKTYDETCDTYDFINKQRGWKYLQEMEENEEIGGSLLV